MSTKTDLTKQLEQDSIFQEKLKAKQNGGDGFLASLKGVRREGYIVKGHTLFKKCCSKRMIKLKETGVKTNTQDDSSKKPLLGNVFYCPTCNKMEDNYRINVRW